MDLHRLFEHPVTDDLTRCTAPGRDDTVLSETTPTIREPRAESREPRAESREPRAESREPRAESRDGHGDALGLPSGEREIAHPGPTRANAPPREVSDAGPDGVYGIGETIAVELRMSRPVQVDGSGTPSIDIDLGGTPR